MSLNTKQKERLEECQRMFLDGEISSREYEIEKSKIINGKSNNWTETDSGLVSSVIIPLFNHAIQSAKDGSLISSILLPLFHFIKFIIKGIYTLAKVGYKKSVAYGKRKGLSDIQIHGITMFFILIFIGGIYGWSSYMNYREIIKGTELQEARVKEDAMNAETQRIAQEKQKVEEERIAQEKAKAPKVSIVLLSKTGSQGGYTGYTLKFTASGASVVNVNGNILTQSTGGIYEKNMILPLGESVIQIHANNSYHEDKLDIIVSRTKTESEIQQDKENEARIAEEARKAEEQKKREFEEEKKTYKTYSYAQLSKNPDKYVGERIKFKGKIFHATEEDDISVFQINTGEYGISDQIFTVANWSNDYVEGNWVTVWGIIVGNYCYTSQAGWNICVPSVKANIIE